MLFSAPQFQRSPFSATFSENDPPQIRLATLDDLEDLVTIDRQCFGKLWSRDQYLREIESPNSDIVLVVSNAASDPQPVTPSILAYGCCWAIVDEAHITVLGTHPDYQRRGYARQVLQQLLVHARDRQLKRATLEVRASNQAAIALYESFGFEEAGRRKKYYSDTQEDALILWKGGLLKEI